MAIDKAVDSAVLDAGLTATANAIRGKTGDSALIEWKNADGFKAAVDAISTGGGGGFPNGTEWTLASRNVVMGSGSRLKKLEYHNGVYVAGGSYTGGYIRYSLDGESWTNTQCKGTCQSLLYQEGLWVAVTDGGIFYSEDGINWNASNVTTGSVSYGSALIYYRGVYVAGAGSKNYYSTDGKNWVNGSVSGAAHGFAVRKGILYGKIGGAVYISSDGITWNSCLSGGKIFEGALFSSDGLLLASDYTWGLKYSVDGETWADTNITTYAFLSKIDDLWFAGTSGGLYYSTDGMTWMQSDLTLSIGCAVVGNNGVYLVAADSMKSLYYSTDGMSWKKTNLVSTYLGNPVHIGNRWLTSYGGDLYESVTWAPSV